MSSTRSLNISNRTSVKKEGKIVSLRHIKENKSRLIDLRHIKGKTAEKSMEECVRELNQTLDECEKILMDTEAMLGPAVEVKEEPEAPAVEVKEEPEAPAVEVKEEPEAPAVDEPVVEELNPYNFSNLRTYHHDSRYTFNFPDTDVEVASGVTSFWLRRHPEDAEKIKAEYKRICEPFYNWAKTYSNAGILEWFSLWSILAIGRRIGMNLPFQYGTTKDYIISCFAPRLCRFVEEYEAIIRWTPK